MKSTDQENIRQSTDVQDYGRDTPRRNITTPKYNADTDAECDTQKKRCDGEHIGMKSAAQIGTRFIDIGKVRK